MSSSEFSTSLGLPCRDWFSFPAPAVQNGCPPSSPSYNGKLRHEKDNYFCYPDKAKGIVVFCTRIQFLHLCPSPATVLQNITLHCPHPWGVGNQTLHSQQLSCAHQWDKSFRRWIGHLPESHQSPVAMEGIRAVFQPMLFLPLATSDKTAFVQTDNWRNSKSLLGYMTICQGPEAPRKWCRDDGWRCETELSLHSWGINQPSGQLRCVAGKPGKWGTTLQGRAWLLAPPAEGKHSGRDFSCTQEAANSPGNSLGSYS